MGKLKGGDVSHFPSGLFFSFLAFPLQQHSHWLHILISVSTVRSIRGQGEKDMWNNFEISGFQDFNISDIDWFEQFEKAEESSLVLILIGGLKPPTLTPSSVCKSNLP